MKKQAHAMCETSGPHGGKYEDNSLVETGRRFRDAYCLHHQGDETSVNFYETTQRKIPEDGHLHAICLVEF
jgi:hypothetical protein